MLPEVKIAEIQAEISLPKSEKNISQEVLFLAAPAIGQYLLEALVFLVDRLMLGRYNGDALASMQISSTLIWGISSLLSSFSIGSISLVGRAIGSGDRALASATVRGSLLFAIVAGTIVSLLSLQGIETLVALFPNSDAKVQEAAIDYISILLPAMPLMLVTNFAATLLRASGNTRSPFLVALVSNGVNALINYFLIFGNWGSPALGVRGAAIGSVAALAINAIVLIILLSRKKAVLTLRGRGGEKEAIARVLRIAWPAFGEEFVQHLGYFGYVAMLTALGSAAMAANQALISIELICFLAADGFGIASATIVAQYLGADRPHKANQGARWATILATVLLMLFSLFFWLIPDELLQIFSHDSQIVAVGVPCLYIAAVAQPFMAISIVLGQSLRGAGDTKSAFYVACAGWLIVRLVATYLFTFVFNLGLIGVWLGSTCDWIVRSIVLAIVFLRGRWRYTLL